MKRSCRWKNERERLCRWDYAVVGSVSWSFEWKRLGWDSPVMVNRSWIYRVLIYIHDTFNSIYSGGQSNHTKVGAHKNNASEIYRSSITSNLNLRRSMRRSEIASSSLHPHFIPSRFVQSELQFARNLINKSTFFYIDFCDLPKLFHKYIDTLYRVQV